MNHVPQEAVSYAYVSDAGLLALALQAAARDLRQQVERQTIGMHDPHTEALRRGFREWERVTAYQARRRLTYRALTR